MHTQVWNKYLPIIKILLKKAVTDDQVLNLNVTDFERAGVARKGGIRFSIQYGNGRAVNLINAPVLAKDFSAALMQDEPIRQLIQQHDYQLSLNTKYQLAIKYLPKPIEEEVPAAEEAL